SSIRVEPVQDLDQLLVLLFPVVADLLLKLGRFLVLLLETPPHRRHRVNEEADQPDVGPALKPPLNLVWQDLGESDGCRAYGGSYEPDYGLNGVGRDVHGVGQS